MLIWYYWFWGLPTNATMGRQCLASCSPGVSSSDAPVYHGISCLALFIPIIIDNTYIINIIIITIIII